MKSRYTVKSADEIPVYDVSWSSAGTNLHSHLQPCLSVNPKIPIEAFRFVRSDKYLHNCVETNQYQCYTPIKKQAMDSNLRECPTMRRQFLDWEIRHNQEGTAGAVVVVSRCILVWHQTAFADMWLPLLSLQFLCDLRKLLVVSFQSPRIGW